MQILWDIIALIYMKEIIWILHIRAINQLRANKKNMYLRFFYASIQDSYPFVLILKIFKKNSYFPRYFLINEIYVYAYVLLKFEYFDTDGKSSLTLMI